MALNISRGGPNIIVIVILGLVIKGISFLFDMYPTTTIVGIAIIIILLIQASALEEDRVSNKRLLKIITIIIIVINLISFLFGG